MKSYVWEPATFLIGVAIFADGFVAAPALTVLSFGWRFDFGTFDPFGKPNPKKKKK